jgi:hypothetical protein
LTKLGSVREVENMTMDYASIGVKAAGQIMGDIGSIMSANEAKRKKSNIKRLIETNDVPLDVDSVTGEAITTATKNQTGVQAMEKSQNTFNLAEIQRLMRESVPGYDEIIGSQSAAIQSYLKGELPPDVQAQVLRKSAGKSLMGGYAGSQMHTNLTARDLGLTSLELQTMGMPQSNAFRSSIPMAKLADYSNYLGLDASQLVDLRQAEKNRHTDLLLAAEGMPSYNDIISGRLISAGDRLAGSGGGIPSNPSTPSQPGQDNSGAQNTPGYDWMNTGGFSR